MGEKFSINKHIVLIGTILFLLTFVQAFDISKLNTTCTANNGVQCPVLSDITSGDCRTTTFSSQNGEVKIMSCVKGDYIEVYRQSFPEGVKEACYSTACVDSIKGFEKKLITELNYKENTEPVVEDPVEENLPEDNNNGVTVPINTNSNFAIDPNSVSGLGISYAQVIDKWNEDTWNDIVDSSFATNADLASVRWYNTEGQCTGDKCQDQLHNGNGACNDLNVAESKFCGVTDEFSNVLLNFAMGSNQDKYDKLHRFSEKLRVPETNNLQCWKYYVSGDKNYNSYKDLCVSKDSASDASIRILGAYGLACAKQRSGDWPVKDIDYCKDYETQGRAVWGYGTADHGEVKKLSNGKYFLCNGYNNQVNCPTASQSFRPDYYELQFMMDFADYMDSNELRQGVLDMLDFYYENAKIGGNMMHIGKTGSQNIEAGSSYVCTDLCTPAYMDNIDTWRAIPAISGLYNVYGNSLSSAQKSLFDYWWDNYVKNYGVNDNKPFEIYSYSKDGRVKSSENSYKTLSMWIPLASAKDSNYAKDSVDKLVSMYRNDEKQFSGAAYYGGYFSQFGQRAIGSATGMISPTYWTGESVSVEPAPVVVEDPIVENPTTEDPQENTGSNDANTGSGSTGGSSGGSSSGSTTTTTITYTSVENIPATCSGGTIVSDDYFGGRRIECVNSQTGSKLTVEAWDKKKGQYFEMYKKAHIGSGIEICLAGTCIYNPGFARSENYPITIETINEVEEETAEEVTNTPLPTKTTDPLYLYSYTCKYEENKNCELIYDEKNGECRNILSRTNYGDIKIMMCLKTDKVEVYRQEYPSGVSFDACFGENCLNEYRGFTSYSLFFEGVTDENTQDSSTENNIENPTVNTNEEVVIAFLGDTGHDYYFGLALDVIDDPKYGVDLIVHSGDLRPTDSIEEVDRFISKVDQHISKDLPIIATVGNHDPDIWDEYTKYLEQRIANSGEEIKCAGAFGLSSTCIYKGIRILNQAPGWLGSGYNVDSAAKESLSKATENWRICTSHLTMNSLQITNKADEAGWNWINTCTEYGAIIQQAHSHLYSRTYSMTDLENKKGIEYKNDPTINLGRTFQFINSIDSRAGRAEYDWPWMAKTYNEPKTIAPLICTFNYQNDPSKAHCKLISGHPDNSANPILDEFTITNLYAK